MLYCWLTLRNGITMHGTKKHKVRHSSVIFLAPGIFNSSLPVPVFLKSRYYWYVPTTTLSVHAMSDIVRRILSLTSSLTQLKCKVIFLNVHLIWTHFTRSKNNVELFTLFK